LLTCRPPTQHTARIHVKNSRQMPSPSVNEVGGQLVNNERFAAHQRSTGLWGPVV
jgi:hypothetical protein